MSNMDSVLLNQLLDQQDSDQKHLEMGEEFSFYNLVKEGKVEELKSILFIQIFLM